MKYLYSYAYIYGGYRYSLYREWEGVNPDTLMFIMLNPSTADGTEDDPTIRACTAIAQNLNYNKYVVGNLFACRATNPKEILDIAGPVGYDNDNYLSAMIGKADLVIAAWGVQPILKDKFKDRVRDVVRLASKPLYALKLTKDGSPRHPLYLKRNSKPFIWVSNV